MNSLTSTPHSCISIVSTVALAEMVTVKNGELTPITMNIVQQDGSSSLTKVCIRKCQCSCSVDILVSQLFCSGYNHILFRHCHTWFAPGVVVSNMRYR